MHLIIVTSAVFYLLWLFKFKGFEHQNVFAYIAWFLHGYLCYTSLFDTDGWKLGVLNSVLLSSFLSVFSVFIFKLFNSWVKIPLVIYVLLAYLLMVIDPDLEGQNLQKFSWELDLHISLSMLAYSILSVAALYAVSLWVHIKRIKNNILQSDGCLLSIIDEEKRLFYIIFLGWLILSTSLLSGVIYVENFISRGMGHKIIFSMLAWLVLGVLVFGRMTRGWRGEKLISLTLIGTLLLATGYLGSKIVVEWIL